MEFLSGYLLCHVERLNSNAESLVCSFFNVQHMVFFHRAHDVLYGDAAK